MPDEIDIESQGGFSISFTRRLCTMDPSREADITLYFNPLIFDNEDIEPLVSISNDKHLINTHELIEIVQT